MSPRIRSICFAVATGVLVVAAAPAAFAQTAPRVVVIDGERVTAETTIGQRVFARFEAAAGEWEQRINTAQTELRAQQQELQSQQLTLAPAALAELRSAIEEKQVEVQRLQADASRALARLQEEATAEVNEVLVPALQAMAAAEGYDLVLDARLIESGGLLFFSDAVDVTDAFIVRVNAATPASDGAR